MENVSAKLNKDGNFYCWMTAGIRNQVLGHILGILF